MNDEPSSSATPTANLAASSQDGTTTLDRTTVTAQQAGQRDKNRVMFNRKRTELLDELLRNLDILIYAELSTIYYLDCSFLKFFLRAFVQLLFLTPKPPMFPTPPPNRPYLGAIIGGNALAILLHLWNAPPSAGEATRGYMHGGLAMDFIGQRGPTSKLHLVILDLLVAIFQLVQLSAFFTKQRIREKRDTPATSAPASRVSNAGQNSGQDLDSEERGVNRVQEQQDIEMQTLNPSRPTERPSRGAEDDDGERDGLLAVRGAPSDDSLLDAFHSGQIVLADLDLVKTVKQQMYADPVEVSDTTESARQLRANMTTQLLRWRFGGNPGNGGPT